MSNDVPAALPLIAYIAGLLCGHSWRDAIALLVVAVFFAALRRLRAAIAFLAAAGGIAAAVHMQSVARDDVRYIASLAADRFVTIEAPLDRDWRVRPPVFALRVARCTVDGRPLHEPMTVLARFAPRPIQLEERIVAEGFLRRDDRDELTLTVKSPRLMRYEGRAARWSPATWNRMLDHRLRRYVALYPTEVALADALALGRGERLADDVRDSYKRAGTYHLLVFSGLQIAIAAAALAALLRWMHAPRVSDWSLLLFAFFAPLFIGPNASVSRAAIAIGLFAVARLLHRPTKLENLWCVGALAWLIAAPGDLSGAAFQLTYAGAGALLFVAAPIAGSRVRWLAYVAGVECVVTPITLFHFHQYALGGSLTTVILTPLVTAMLVISALACAVPGALTFGSLRLLHRVALRLNDAAAVATGAFAAPPAMLFSAAMLCALLSIALFRHRQRAAAICICLACAALGAWWVAHRQVEVPEITMLDIGQGDAILLRARGHAMLIDGGPSPTRLIPLLADRGVRHLDVVLLTHAHPDHCGGLPAVLSRFDVGQLWISPRRFLGDCAQELLATATAARIPVHLVRDGDSLGLGPIRVRAFLPDRTFRHSPENNSSIVLEATIGHRRALLTGDIEREAESGLADRIRRVDVLKVAHHGSRSSSTDVLLDRASPRLALISCGRRNMFGHPHAVVLEALQKRAVRVMRTDRDGTVFIAFHDEHLFARREIDTLP